MKKAKQKSALGRIVGIGLISCCLLYSTKSLAEISNSVERNANNAIVVTSSNALINLSSKVKQKVNETLNNYSVFSVDLEKLYSEVKKDRSNTVLKLNLGEIYSWEINLQVVDLRSNDYVLQMSDDERTVSFPKTFEVNTYKGTVNGDPSKIARLSIRENTISGYIQDGDHFVYIESLNKIDASLNSDLFVAYEMKEVHPSAFGTCLFSSNEAESNVLKKMNNSSSLSAGCRNLQIALIADYSLLQGYGNVTEVENNVFDIVNQAQGYYSTLDIELSITALVIPTTKAANPFNGQTDGTQFLTTLKNFNFGAGISTDLKGAFFKKDFPRNGDYQIAGYADGAACTGSNRSIYEISIFNGVSGVIFAHEIGHNLTAVHIAGSNYIMNPTSTATGTTWDPTNTTNINNFLNGSGSSCISNCSVAPQANFTQDAEFGCTSLIVNFKDNSSLTPASWLWDFGDGSTSTLQNPTHTYTSPGTYTVKLTATNAFGSTTKTKTNAIAVGTAGLKSSVKVGPPDYNFGTGGYKTASAWMQFDALSDFILKSFQVNAEVSGARMFLLTDDKAAHNVYRAEQIQVPQGVSRVNLNWQIKGGSTYQLFLAGESSGFGITQLWRTQIGATYPQTIPGVISITTNQFKDANPTVTDLGWYIGYDWEIQELLCGASVGINEKNINTGELSVYPNPSQGNLFYRANVADAEYSIIIINYLGQKVFSENVIPNNGIIFGNISTKSLASGFYSLMLTSNKDNSVLVKKIVLDE